MGRGGVRLRWETPMKTFAGRVEPPLSQEAILVDYTERLARHTAGRLAAHIHISKLKAHNRREHHVRVAANTFETLVKSFEGQIFVLNNSDIVFICKGATMAELDEAAARRTMNQQQGQPMLQPITPDQLAKVEAAIAQADLSNVVRRQPVCAIVKDGLPQPV